MKKILFLILFCFLSIGCNKKETKIELPNQLKWGMSVDDVKLKGVDISLKGESKNHNNQYYLIKSESFPELNFKIVIFKQNNGLINYTQNSNYYSSPTVISDESYDPTGEKAISLYNSYISKFDKLYYSSSVNKSIDPRDNFWVNPTCEGDRPCIISEKMYTDNIDTELKITLSVIKAENSIDNVGIVQISFIKKE
ncbi:hypothetical protein [Gilliamella sp. wkB178]|uniref:hypothetical protein n=1 Tax=Gilliamella sp. wkB178 TaxID=3120259 RepID=UPI00114765EA|nr:hypothetical protein [Gilliamella apicola]